VDTLVSPDIIEFGAFWLDRRNGELLRRDGSGTFRQVRIGPRALSTTALDEATRKPTWFSPRSPTRDRVVLLSVLGVFFWVVMHPMQVRGADLQTTTVSRPPVASSTISASAIPRSLVISSASPLAAHALSRGWPPQGQL
jgi:hypothetical protein